MRLANMCIELTERYSEDSYNISNIPLTIATKEYSVDSHKRWETIAKGPLSTSRMRSKDEFQAWRSTLKSTAELQVLPRSLH